MTHPSEAEAGQVEASHPHRTDIEELVEQAKHGAAPRHLASGDASVNTAWVHAAFLAVAVVAWLNMVTETDRASASFAGAAS